jgi:hypothetical protein
VVETEDEVYKNDDKDEIIGIPIKIGNFEIAQNDFSTSRSFEDAKKSCSNLGKGWKLPTKEELNEMYLNKDKIGGLSTNVYWSLT